MLDVIDFMTLSGLHDAALIGTSRGGLITMLMAAAQPTAIGAVVLNDIGPVIEHEGMARISGYVGRVPLPISWADAARMMRELNRRHFPEISEAVWEDVARQWYNESNGKPAPGYDYNLGNALSVLDGPMPALWPQFEALKRVPLMVVRGENSDILTGDDGRRDAAPPPRHGDRHRGEPGPRAAAEGPHDHRGHPPLPDGGRCGPPIRDAGLCLKPYGAGNRASRAARHPVRPAARAIPSRRSRGACSPSTGDEKSIQASPGPAVR